MPTQQAVNQIRTKDEIREALGFRTHIEWCEWCEGPIRVMCFKGTDVCSQHCEQELMKSHLKENISDAR